MIGSEEELRAKFGEVHPLARVALGVRVRDVVTRDLEAAALRHERRQRDVEPTEFTHGCYIASSIRR